MKLKEFGPLGGVPCAPLRSANDVHFKLALPTEYKYWFFILSLNAKIY